MNTLQTYGRRIGAVLVVLAVVAVCYAIAHYGTSRYSAGVEAGRNAVLADDARAVQQAQQARDALDAYSAAAGGRLQQSLGTALPIIQGQTHDTTETIRTIYRDRPVPAVACSRPDGVQDQLNAAIDRANAAAGPPGDVRPDPAGTGAGTRPAVRDGR